MTEPKPDTLDFLFQLDITDGLLPKIGKEQWQVLYQSRQQAPHRFAMSCALLNRKAAATAMDHDTWDLGLGHGKPGFSESWSPGKEKIKYHRFGYPDGVRPLVHYRSFEGAY